MFFANLPNSELFFQRLWAIVQNEILFFFSMYIFIHNYGSLGVDVESLGILTI